MPDQKNEGLQAARAIAALTVAYFHSYIALRGFPDAAQIPIEGLKNWGYLGVNFFFAISGYVICIVASKPSFSPMSFAIKRLFRLYPMYWAAMAVIAVLILLGKYRHEPIGHFLYSMTLLPQPSASAYDVSWTLERELVFYALAASIVPFFGVRGLAFALAGLAWAGWYFGNPWTYHLVSTTQADFLAGVIVFLVFDRLRFGAVAPILVGAALLVYTRSHDFVFSVSLCMGIILLGMTNIRLPWERRPFRWLVAAGDASYSIYLLHYLTFFVSVNICVRIPHPDWLCEPWRFGTLLACCFVSRLTWRKIELPAIRMGNRVAESIVRQKDPAPPALSIAVGDNRPG